MALVEIKVDTVIITFTFLGNKTRVTVAAWGEAGYVTKVCPRLHKLYNALKSEHSRNATVLLSKEKAEEMYEYCKDRESFSIDDFSFLERKDRKVTFYFNNEVDDE